MSDMTGLLNPIPAPVSAASMRQTRGERNNNPGNIDRTNPRTRWQGRTMPDGGSYTDARFETFIHAKWGIRAIAGTLMAYHDKHGLNTVAGLINRWAPPVENQTNSYVNHVCENCGVTPDAALDLAQYPVMRGLVVGIILHENGRNLYSDALIDEGLKLAGLPAPVKPITATPTGTATLLTGGAGILGVAISSLPTIIALTQGAAAGAPSIDTLTQLTPLLEAVAGLAPMVAVALIVCTAAVVIAWRMSQRRDIGV